MHQPVAVVRPALVDDAAQLAGDVLVVGRDRAALAGRQLLVRVEAVDRGIAVGADSGAVDAGAQRLAGVLNDRHAGRRGDLVDPPDLARVAEDVHRKDRPRARCDRGLDGRRIEVQRLRVDVGEHRGGVLEQRRVGGCDEREPRGHHLVAGADVQPRQAGVQPGRAAGAGDGEPAACGRGERLLEPGQHRAQRQRARAQHLQHQLLLPRVDRRAGERDGARHDHSDRLRSGRPPQPDIRGTRATAPRGRRPRRRRRAAGAR